MINDTNYWVNLLEKKAKMKKNQEFNATAQQILQDFKKKEIDAFSYIAWLQVSEILDLILFEVDSLHEKAIHIIELIRFYWKEFFDNVCPQDTKNYFQKVYKKEKVLKIAEKMRQQINETKTGKKSTNIKILFSLLCQFELEAEKKIQKKDYYQFIEKVLMQNTQCKSSYDEIAFNWIKSRASQFKFNESSLCCKFFWTINGFSKEKQLNVQEGIHLQFCNYDLPITSVEIKKKITQNIVGFLNKSGGIIINGVKQDSTRKSTLTGKPLTKFELKKFSQFVMGIVNDIYPKHPEFNEKFSQNSVEFNELRGVCQLNNYISFEYQSLVDEDELTKIKIEKTKQTDQDKYLYILKIIVKPGHPEHLYHLITDQKILQFYIRQEKFSNKKQFVEAHEIITKRTLDYLNLGDAIKIDKFHEGCRVDVQIRK